MTINIIKNLPIDAIFSPLLSFGWIILLGMSIHYIKNIKKYGIKNVCVISSILYLCLSTVVYYDYFIFSKMSGDLNLIMSYHPLSKLYRVLLFGSVGFLYYKFGLLVYERLKKKEEVT